MNWPQMNTDCHRLKNCFLQALYVLHGKLSFVALSVCIRVHQCPIRVLEKPLVYDTFGRFFEHMHPENEHLEAFIFGLAMVVAVINLLGDDR